MHKPATYHRALARSKLREGSQFFLATTVVSTKRYLGATAPPKGQHWCLCVCGERQENIEISYNGQNNNKVKQVSSLFIYVPVWLSLDFLEDIQGIIKLHSNAKSSKA